MCWSMGLVCGSSIALFCRRMNTSISSPLFGRTGVPGGSLFRPWRIGGREESLGSRVLPSRTVKTGPLVDERDVPPWYILLTIGSTKLLTVWYLV